MRMAKTSTIVTVGFVLFLAGQVSAEEGNTKKQRGPGYSPYVRGYPQRVFFGGWEFTKEDAKTRFPGEEGYKKGVPMGGGLSNAPKGKAPTFLVAALKDQFSGNLDRTQIIKGWLNADGGAQEKAYNVAISDGRKIGQDGRCRTPVGNTVDVENAIWTNTIGDPDLIAVWKDPDFEPDEKACYYARVIEIPTPRRTAYDLIWLGADMPEDVKMITQERAYTSPIWYTP